MSKISELAEEKKFEELENEYLYGQSNENIDLPNQIKNEEIYNAKNEYNEYLKFLDENVEYYNQEEIEKLKTEEAFDIYMSLTQAQKEQMFPLSFDDGLDNEFIMDDEDKFIADEEDTRLI